MESKIRLISELTREDDNGGRTVVKWTQELIGQPRSVFDRWKLDNPEFGDDQIKFYREMYPTIEKLREL